MPAAIKSKSEIRLGFFELLFENSEGYINIFTTDPKAPKSAVVDRFFEWPRESLKLENYILHQEVNKNVYFCVSLLKQQERKKKHCLPTDLVWADLDTVNPDSLTKLPPTIVLQSSPGRWQAFWRLSTKVEPFDAERYSRRVAYAIGADKSGWDMVQLLRVPLTRNWKYHPAMPIALEKAVNVRVDIDLLESVFLAAPEETQTLDKPIPSEGDREVEEIIAEYSHYLDMDRFTSLYTYQPKEDEDWSKLLWSLEVMCFRAGMTAEEVFVVAQASACNKFARDGRPVEHLWRDVLKAADNYGALPPDKELLEMPQLVDEPASETFIDEYKSWACDATDAIQEFHELSAFMVLSAITASSLRLETSWGTLAPNIWGLILGDSTVTRKSTAMKMAIDMLTTLEPELILATDGSVEGLLSGMSTRPNKVSVFFRDEVSGLFDSINKKDYLSSMPETLAHLYDVPPVYSRLLRKEVIRIESPAFIFFGGGITERVYANVSESWIESGFMPRFMIVSGDFDRDKMVPTGPPTQQTLKKKAGILDSLTNLYENYASEVQVKIGGKLGGTMMVSPRIAAALTNDAWTKYQEIENKLTVVGYESPIRNTALPTFDRMARSILKMGMILAATRQEPDEATNSIIVEESDIINAAWYAQNWGRHSVELVLNAGKSVHEKILERVRLKIENNPGLLRSTLMQHLHLTKRETDEIIGTLEERSQIIKEKAGRGWRYRTI
jgi:hypothetical protein